MLSRLHVPCLLLATALVLVVSPATCAHAASTLAAAEYFIDTDPGVGQGTAILAKDGAFDGQTEDVELSLDTSTLSPGVHTAYLRMKSAAGTWSIARKLVFNVVQAKTIAAEEYFIDQDPGEGLGTPLLPGDGTFDQGQEGGTATIDTADLSLGMHKLSVRAKDSEGQWGVPRVANFEVVTPPSISAMEYFVDGDPGQGNGMAITAQDGSYNAASEAGQALFNSSALAYGPHTISVRAKDTNNKWGLAKDVAFTVAKLLTISKSGSGTGGVTSGDAPQTIACGADCTELYDAGTVVLTAVADPGSTFSGWTGCPQATDTVCTVTMDQDVPITAEFNDLTPPATAITETPAALSATSTATFSFTATEAKATFECQVDTGEYTPCATPKSYSGLSDGNHTVSIRAVDAAGNIDPTPATHAWFIDATAPVVSAGPDQSKNALFTQTATAQDQGAMTYAWSKQAGNGALTFASPTALSTTIAAGSDGTYTIRFTATDALGNSGHSDMTLVWDTTAPAITGLANDTNPVQAKTWSWQANESATFRYAIDQDAVWQPAGEFTDTHAATVIGQDGTWYLHAQAQDAAGNLSPVVTVSALFDNTAPPGTVVINQGAAYSNNTSVTLTLTANNATEISTSTDGATYGAWLPYAESTPLTLPAGDGEKTVSVKFKDVVGNVSVPVFASIHLDQTAPAVTGLADSTSPVQAKTWSWQGDEAATYRFAIDQNPSWEAVGEFGSTNSATVSGQDGSWYLHVQAKDIAGNLSPVATVAVALDNTPPTGTVVINSGDSYTNSTAATVTLSADSAVQMSINVDDTGYGAWQTYTVAKAITLPAGDGEKTVAVQFKDSAGNISAPVTDTIILDSVYVPDSDMDGLSDVEEALVGSSPEAADTDGDGLKDIFDPTPLTNDFAGQPEWLPPTSSQDAPIALTLATLYQDSIDSDSGDHWYALTIGKEPGAAGIHHLLLNPLPGAVVEKTPGAGRLQCTVYAVQPDGQLVQIRSSELLATEIQAFRLPLNMGKYLLKVTAKDLTTDDFQLIALKSTRLYDMSLTVNEQGQVQHPLVIPSQGRYRLYARVETDSIQGQKSVSAALYAGKLNGEPAPEKLIHDLGNAAEFLTTLHLKSGIITLAVADAAPNLGVRLWLEEVSGEEDTAEFEPNQTIASSDSLSETAVVPKGQPLSRTGVLYTPADQDLFGFLVGEEEDSTHHAITVHIALDPGTLPPGALQELYLLSASGQTLKLRTGIGSGKINDTVTTLLPAGVYYLRVMDAADDEISSQGTGYTLTVTDSSGQMGPLPGNEGGEEVVLQQYYSLLSAILYQDEWNENSSANGDVKEDPYGEVIILAGVGDDPADTLYNATQKLADNFYYYSSVRGYSDETIYYLNANPVHDIDGDGMSDQVVDNATPTPQALMNAITWAAERKSTGPLYLYLVDHGGKQQFLISQKTNKVITATILDAVLDEFQNKTNRPVVVIIEACYSGSFVAPLTSDGQLQRAVLASSAWNEQSMIEPGGSVSFTRFLYKELYKGQGLAAAFDKAKGTIKSDAYNNIYQGQHPQAVMADLGALKLGIPYAIADSGYAAAAVVSKFMETTGSEGGIVIDADNPQAELSAAIYSVSGIKRVWATVLPPNYTPPAISEDFKTTDLGGVTLELPYDTKTGNYQAVFSPPDPGVYAVTYYLEDFDGEIVSTAGNGTSGLTFNLTSGWNLLGARVTIDLVGTFSDTAKFVSVWKWANGSGTWAVALPGTADGGAAYATGKGFALLATINPGEGFWVNSVGDGQIQTSGPLENGAPAVSKGWNLVALKASQAMTVAEVAAMDPKILSLWKWDNGTWAVSLPGEPTPGTYAQGKGFTVLNTISPGEGFWVNMQ